MMSASSLLLTAFSQAVLQPYKWPLVQSHTKDLQLKMKPPGHTLRNRPFAFAPRAPFNKQESPVHLYRIIHVIDTGSTRHHW